MCAVDGRPFNIVNGEGFRHAFECGILLGQLFGHFPVSEALPCRQTLANQVASLADECEAKLKERLEKLSSLAITLDHYKDKVSQVCLPFSYIDFMCNIFILGLIFRNYSPLY